MELYDGEFRNRLKSLNVDIKPFRVRSRSRADQVLSRIAKPNAGLLEDKRFAAILLDSDLDFDTEPASIYEPELLKEAIFKYFTGVKEVTDEQDVDEVIYSQALNDAYHAFKPLRKIQALSLNDKNQIIRILQKDTSSGYPYFKRKDESYEYAFTRADLVLNYRKAPNPCVSFFRTQRIKGDSSHSKVRLVWGEPMEMTIIESLYARPLIDYYLEYQVHPVAFGLSKLQISGRMTNVLNQKWQYSLDYSQFDSRVSARLIREAFNIFFSWIDDVDPNASVIKERIISYAIATPLLTPWGLITGKKGGINSGNYFTQLLGSFINYFYTCYFHRMNDVVPHRENINVLGDDGVFGLHKKLTRFDEFQSKMKVNINVVKSEISEDGNRVHFLGRYYHNGLPHGDGKESRTKLVFPERNRNIKREQVRLVIASYLLEHVENAQWINPLIMYGSDLSFYLAMHIFNDKIGSRMEDSRELLQSYGAKAGFVTNLHFKRQSISLAHGLLC